MANGLYVGRTTTDSAAFQENEVLFCSANGDSYRRCQILLSFVALNKLPSHQINTTLKRNSRWRT